MHIQLKLNTQKSPLFLVLFVLSFLLNSCSSYKQIPYFKNITDSQYIYHQGEEIKDTNANTSILLKPKDIVQIKIYTSDGNISNIGSSPNKTYGKLDIGSSISGVDPFNASNDYNYILDKNGNIKIPSIGTVHLSGFNVELAQDEVYKKVKVFLSDPVVSVKMVNFKITVLGEVNKPGTYIIDGDNVTLMEALGMAGDMTVFGKRENVLLIHKIDDYHTKLIRFNLNDKKTMLSPFYHLQQNDIIYIEPNKGKAAANDASQIRTYAIISTIASIVLALIYSLRK
jgi:polysaccharide biosynthesis/export protein